MSTVLSVLAALLLISLLITVHELGHFLVGKKLGFSILEFAIGMGPVIAKKEKDGILYSLRALPIGGMCRFYGEDENAHDPRCFNAQAAWKRILVIVTGPVMNIVFAFLFAILTLSVYGNLVPSVYEVSGATSPAAVAGLEPGDVIVEINGERIRYYSQTTVLIQSMPSDSAVIVVERDGREIPCTLKNTYDAELGHNLIGITISPVRKEFTFLESIGGSYYYIAGTVVDTFSYLKSLITGRAQLSDASSIIRVVAYVSEAVRYSFESVLQLMVLVSASIGIFNLLPLPALDGGRLVFLVIEAIRGKPVNQKVEGMVHFIGLIALFGLMIVLAYNDIVFLIRQ